MDSKGIWNKIVSEYVMYKDALENKIQNLWEGYFSNFFEYERKTDFLVQVPLRIGSTDKKADIVLTSNNIKLCVIELKQYSYQKETDYEKQLFSYMTHVDIHSSIGILICSKIYLYKYDFLKNQSVCVEIPFEKDNPYGIDFVNLFIKQNFNLESISNFIISKNEEINKIFDIKESITNSLIIRLLKEHFADKCSEQEFNTIMDDFIINIIKKETNQTQLEKNCTSLETKNSGQKDTTKYSFDGVNYFGKCKFPFEVVKHYILQNPDITFTELKTIFPDGKNMCGVDLFIEKLSNVPKKDIDGNRYSGLNAPIKLKSGESIVVSNQYDPTRISYFNKVATKLGYKIMERK